MIGSHVFAFGQETVVLRRRSRRRKESCRHTTVQFETPERGIHRKKPKRDLKEIVTMTQRNPKKKKEEIFGGGRRVEVGGEKGKMLIKGYKVKLEE